MNSYGYVISESRKSLDFFMDIFFTSRFSYKADVSSYRLQTGPASLLLVIIFLKHLIACALKGTPILGTLPFVTKLA